MSGTLAGLVLIGIAGFVVWSLTAGRTVFVVRLVNGAAVRTRGSVTDQFLTELEALAHEHRLTSGHVRGVLSNDGRIRLRFSRDFAPGSQQQLRNWWNCHGWSASPLR
jgi:hypothetical protein